MAKISGISANTILDSRGERTLEVRVFCGETSAKASVPRGKSAGKHEAKSLPAEAAVRNVEKLILPKLLGKDAADQGEIDGILLSLDKSPDKKKIGGNAALGVSAACAKLGAMERKIPLWKYLRELGGFEAKQKRNGIMYPRLYINMVNGGLHAGNNLDFQEYLLIPKAGSFKEAVKIGTDVYGALRERLSREKGRTAVNLGDEGGFAPDFAGNAEPFEIMADVAEAMGYSGKFELGLDAAASGISIPTEELFMFYKGIAARFPLAYIEDPFGEENFREFFELLDELGGVKVAGDDLTTTNVSRMEKARMSQSVNAVIVKPNQIGTVSETLDAVKLARKYGWEVVVSHRSGETNDDFIADLAVGVGADGFKLGAPARGERVAKYNRLLQIENEELQNFA